MRAGLFANALAFALAVVGVGCSAMSAPNNGARCRVLGNQKLPVATGGSAALCQTIEQAMDAASAAPYAVEVRVLGPAALAATVTTSDGRILPEHRFSSSDRSLSRSSIGRFARALARKLAEAEER